MMERTADHIRQVLEQDILTGAFDDGFRLDEVTLCTRFGVSRTPVREALVQLASSGLVEAIARRGVFVRVPGFAEVVEMFEVMGELEGMCGRLAARRITDEQLKRFVAACLRCERAERTGGSDRYYQENETFHQILYEASGNGFLRSQALHLQKRLQPFRRLQLKARGRLRQSLDEHCAILKAIESGDQPAAETLLRDHVTLQGERFLDLMRELKSPPARKAV